MSITPNSAILPMTMNVQLINTTKSFRLSHEVFYEELSAGVSISVDLVLNSFQEECRKERVLLMANTKLQVIRNTAMLLLIP